MLKSRKLSTYPKKCTNLRQVYALEQRHEGLQGPGPLFCTSKNDSAANALKQCLVFDRHALWKANAPSTCAWHVKRIFTKSRILVDVLFLPAIHLSPFYIENRDE